MRLKNRIDDDRIIAVAAGVTFYMLLAVFPAVTAFVSLYGLFTDPASLGDKLAAVQGVLPGGAIDIVGEQIKRLTESGASALSFAFAAGLAMSIWSANAGMKAVFDALNIAYEEKEKRNFFMLNLVSLCGTVGAVAFLGLAISAVVVIPIVLNYFGLGGITDWIVWAGRWPLLLVLTALALSVLYRVGPSRPNASWRWVTPGSAFAACAWLAGSMLFSWYVGSFGNYNKTYGSLGAAIGFMTWMWLSSIIVLVGAELNAQTEAVARPTSRKPER